MKKKNNETIKNEKLNHETGEVTEIPIHLFDKVIVQEGLRENGTYRYSLDFSNCVSRTDQSDLNSSNIDYLMEKFQPDELAVYLAQRNSHRIEITDHDFSQEPDAQGARNMLYESKQQYENLPPEVRNLFKTHLDFLKFVDNPSNAETMVRLGLATVRQIETIQMNEPNQSTSGQNQNQNQAPNQNQNQNQNNSAP